MGKLHLHLMLTEKIRRDILKNNKESYIEEGIIYKMIVADNEDPSGMVIEMEIEADVLYCGLDDFNDFSTAVVEFFEN